MGKLKELIQKYSAFDMNPEVITYMWNSSSESEQWQLYTDEDFFFEKYQQYQYPRVTPGTTCRPTLLSQTLTRTSASAPSQQARLASRAISKKRILTKPSRQASSRTHR